jgi:hypothetical protein
MEAQKKTSRDVISERKRILATLVDAYLVDQSPSHVLQTSDGTIFHHPGLPRGFTAEMSHIDALGADRQLIVTPGAKRYERKINIPTSLLVELDTQEQEALGEPAGQARVDRLAASQVFNQHFHAPVSNVAQGSSHVRQHATMGIQAGDLAASIERLRAIGVPLQDIRDLEQELEADHDPAVRRDRVWGWFARFATAVGSGTASGVLSEQLPQVTTAIAAYVGLPG